MKPVSSVVPGRRRFLQLLSLAGFSNLLSIPLALAQGATKGAGKPIAKPRPKPQPVAPTKPEDEISEDAKTLAAIVRRRYGKHLDEKQLESVTRDLDGDIKAGQRMRLSKLANSDEPDFVFKA